MTPHGRAHTSPGGVPECTGVSLIPMQTIAVRASPSVTCGWGCLVTAEGYRWGNTDLRREGERDG